MYTIYAHIFPNGKRYIGATKLPVKVRFGVNGNNYKTQELKDAIKEYGWDNIKHKVLKDNLTYEQAVKYEKHFIEKFKTLDSRYGYNKMKGGGISPNHKTHVYKMTENRKKFYESLIDVPLSDKHKDNIRQGHLKRLNKYVCQYDKENNLIKKWDSLCQIQDVLGFKKNWVSICCKNNESLTSNFKCAYNYIWRYEKKES